MLRVGIAKEIKRDERRVAMIPKETERLIREGIEVYIEKGAGERIGYKDEEYEKVGCKISKDKRELYEIGEIIVKVKEPQEEEYEYIRENHKIMTFFHFASSSELLKRMMEKRTSCYAYETIRDKKGEYPILREMSKIAGEQAMIEADRFRKSMGGDEEEEITIIGIGNVGKAAGRKAKELKYKKINVIDQDNERLKEIEKEGYKIYEMNEINISKLLMRSKIVIGSIYSNGRRTKKIIIKDLIVIMPKDSIIMDVAIDQGGITEKSTPTTVNNPYIKYHNTYIYCVPNIPSIVAKEASEKLSEVIYPYVKILAEGGTNEELESGLNIRKGEVIHPSLRLLLLPMMLDV